MLTCGKCYHYRSGRCKNKKAATYNAFYPADSQGCQMHLSRMILPFGMGINILAAVIIIPIQIILLLTSGGSSSTSNSSSGGFRL